MGSGSNGAIIHYHPDPQTSARIDKRNLLLCDSGGQYRYETRNDVMRQA